MKGRSLGNSINIKKTLANVKQRLKDIKKHLKTLVKTSRDVG
jgi:hypothetical protein